MKLYFVERCLDENPLKCFYPRIPEFRLKNENSEIPRICLSDSIEGCLSAAPWGGDNIGEVGKLEALRVYEFNVDNYDNILFPEELVKSKYVPDANITGEHWVLNQNLYPDSTYYISLIDFEKRVISHFIKLEEVFYEKIYDVSFDTFFNIPYRKKLSTEKRRELTQLLWDYYSFENTGYIKVKEEANQLKVQWKFPFGFDKERLIEEMEEVLYD